MKKLLRGKAAIFIAVGILYILGQTLGVYAIKALFMDYNIQNLKPQIEDIARGLGDSGTGAASANTSSDASADTASSASEAASSGFPGGAAPGGRSYTSFIVKAYSADGSRLEVSGPRQPELDHFGGQLDAQLIRLIPAAMSGSGIAKMMKIGTATEKSIVIGVPIMKNGKAAGAAFLLKPASDYETIINEFTLVFSVTLLVGTIIIAVFLARYIRESKRLESMRREYIANISHELKSPIASIKALTETLSDGVSGAGGDAETRQRYYGIILSESRRLEKLISEMLELSRLQSGKTALGRQKTDLTQVMRAVNEKYSLLADDIGAKLVTDPAVFALPPVMTNADRIHQVLGILLDNALKFIGDDGSIELGAKITKTHVEISVADNGPGIDKKSLPYIFDRFYKSDSAKEKGGSGLGLAIAREIITGLGEKIEAYSEPGAGSRFVFTVRRA
jgi:signal transduction histidine kinase